MSEYIINPEYKHHITPEELRELLAILALEASDDEK